MNLVIPMAGKGKRLRPHTLTIPKPLLPIAGVPIVQRLVEDIAEVVSEPIRKIGFIVGDFGEAVEKQLLEIAREVGAEGRILYQEEALGTGHAVHCARELLEGKVIVAFADTLFKATFRLDTESDGVIWVKRVENPAAYGVVTLANDGLIKGFVEKPQTPVSDLAIIGIYYFANGGQLRHELDRIIEEDIRVSGEYQLTTALEDLKNQGVRFTAGTVDEWLDCGNKQITVESNSRYLGFLKENTISETADVINSVIIPPVYIGAHARISESVIGPYVSIGERTDIQGSRIRNSLIQSESSLINVNLINSMIGNFVRMEADPTDVSIGDFSEWKG